MKKDYYADRPTEPYSDDDNPNDWANIAHYAEENLEKAFKSIADLEKENAELKKLFADCDTCKRTCDIGNCCKFGSDYLPDVEKVLNEQKQLTKAKELLKKLYLEIRGYMNDQGIDMNVINEVYDFIKSEVEK